MKHLLLATALFLANITILCAQDDDVDMAALQAAQADVAQSANSAEAAVALKDVRALGIDKKTEQEILNLAASVFGTIGKDAKSSGDLEKIIEDGKTNPEAFATRFTPEQRAKLKEIADKIDASRSKKK